MFLKILVLIVNFNLVFQPLTINLYLTSLFTSKVRAQNDFNFPSFDVEIVPISSASSTDIVGAVGDYFCNPFEGNVFFESRYKQNVATTVIEKVKARFLNNNEGCESVWPQLLFRFRTATSGKSLSDFLISNFASTTFYININLNFRNKKDEDLKLLYRVVKSPGLPIETKIEGNEGPVNNIIITSFNGRGHVYVDNTTSTTVVEDKFGNYESYFDLHLYLRTHYYFRDEPYVDSLIDYENKIINNNHPDFNKRFVIKEIGFFVEKDGVKYNLIKGVNFFKDAESYGNYLEGVEGSVTLATSSNSLNSFLTSTLTLTSIEFNNGSINNGSIKGIVGFFPTFLESLPQTFSDLFFGDACKYYERSENGPIILLPYQFVSVYSVSVSATGTCENPPRYNNGIEKVRDNFCFKFTNRLLPCEISNLSGSTSTSLCMAGFPLYSKFKNGYYYPTTSQKVEYWKLDDPKGYRIIKKINESIKGFPPSMSQIFTSSSTDKYTSIYNNSYFQDIVNKRHFYYNNLKYSSSSFFSYMIYSTRQLFGVDEEEINEDYLKKTCGASTYSYYQAISTDDNVNEFSIYYCSSTIGNIEVGILPNNLRDHNEEIYRKIYTQISDDTGAGVGSPLAFGIDYFVLGNNLDIFIKPPAEIKISAPTSTPTLGASLVFSSPSTKYELNTLSFLPRIYYDREVSYVYKLISPYSIKNGTLSQNKEDYFIYNEVFPNGALRSFGSFEKFTSNCTLPQYGFNDVALQINPPPSQIEYITTTECSYYPPSPICKEVIRPILKESQCYTTFSTGTISFFHDITAYTQHSGKSEKEIKLNNLNNYLALSEYRSKGKNINRIRFEIYKKFSQSLSSSLDKLLVSSVEYERKYIPRPQLAQYIDKVASSIWDGMPNEIKGATEEARHRIVEEVFSNLPLFLSLKKIENSDNSSITFNKVPEEINLNVYKAKVDWSEEVKKLPWLYYFLKTLSSSFRLLYSVIQVIELGLSLFSYGFLPIVFMVVEWIFFASLVIDAYLLIAYPEYATTDAWLSFALSSVIFFTYTGLGKEIVEMFNKSWPEVPQLIKNLTHPVIKGINWVRGGVIWIEDQIALGLSTLETYAKIFFTTRKEFEFLAGGFSNLAKISIAMEMFNGIFYAKFVPGKTYLLSQTFRTLSSLMALYELPKITKLDKDKIIEYRLKSLGISYGYKVDGLNFNPTQEEQEYFPALTLIGKPTFDPDYPEYGYYEPKISFLGNHFVLGRNCKTLSCKINKITSAIEVTTEQANLDDFNISSIKSEFSPNMCRVFVKLSSTTATSTSNLPGITNATTVISLDENYIGGGVNLNSFKAKLNINFNRENIFYENVYEENGNYYIPADFVYNVNSSTYHYFIKKNSTSSLNITTAQWLLGATGNDSKRSYECGNYMYSNVYNLVNIATTVKYKIECKSGTKLKWKGMDVANTCLGWVCEYDPLLQPSLEEVKNN